MPLSVALTHRTTYRYDRAVTLGPQTIRLRPAPHARTPILSYALQVAPQPHFINWQQDPQGNHLARVVFPERVTHFDVTVDLVADMATINPFDFFLEPEAENWPFGYDPLLEQELAPFRRLAPTGPLLHALVDQVPRGEQRTVDMLVALNRIVQSRVAYIVRMEPGVWTPEETLAAGKGSCRDSAWLLVQVLRRLGYAARFVSGYLIQLVGDVKPLEGPEGPTADFTDLHAWAEAYLPGAGWVGFDPTSGLLAGEGHIPLACTPDASSAAPISGLLDPCNTEFSHEMTVERIYESPRVTKPYTAHGWHAIEKLGHQVDADLRAGDVRLTMGGEPTFVSLDDADGAEWTTAALGPVKRQRAVELLGRLRQRFAPHGLLHFGQGKWYPDEPLPRWAFACHWRKDGVPIWEDASLIAEDGKDYGYTAEHARQFLEALTRRLQVDVAFTIAAYEDVFYYLWKERKLPINVDPLDPKLADPIERAHLARIFEQGLDRPIGYVLPLRRIPTRSGTPRWTSQPWFLASKQMFLIPGDSSMGYRLPLESLPWTKPEDVIYSYDPDPFEKRARLPAKPERKRYLFDAPSVPDDPVPDADKAEPPEKGESAAWIARPALCVETRQGKLFVFMPPVEHLADYLDLAAAIEDTAAYLKMPVLLEGYAPPSDPRIAVLKVTPDPGVIEVNIHPAASWDELTANTTALYELARQSRLGTE